MAPEALAHVQRVRVTEFRFTERWRVIGGAAHGGGGGGGGGGEDAETATSTITSTTTTTTTPTGGEDTIRGLRLLAQRCTNLKELTIKGGGCLMAELPNIDGSRGGRLIRRMPSASELLTCFPVNVALLEMRGLAKVEFELGKGVCGGCAKHGRAEALFGGLKDAVEKTLVLPKEEKEEGDEGEDGEDGEEGHGEQGKEVTGPGSKRASSSRVRKRKAQLTVRKRRQRRRV